MSCILLLLVEASTWHSDTCVYWLDVSFIACVGWFADLTVSWIGDPLLAFMVGRVPLCAWSFANRIWDVCDFTMEEQLPIWFGKFNAWYFHRKSISPSVSLVSVVTFFVSAIRRCFRLVLSLHCFCMVLVGFRPRKESVGRFRRAYLCLVNFIERRRESSSVVHGWFYANLTNESFILVHMRKVFVFLLIALHCDVFLSMPVALGKPQWCTFHSRPDMLCRNFVCWWCHWWCHCGLLAASVMSEWTFSTRSTQILMSFGRLCCVTWPAHSASYDSMDLQFGPGSGHIRSECSMMATTQVTQAPRASGQEAQYERIHG